MPFFKTITIIEDHDKYKTELKAALKLAAGKKFLYFNKHKLTPKRDHLLVIDPPPDVAKALGAPKAQGKCELNDKDEIVLAPSAGKMRVRPVRKYVETFFKEKQIFVPADEPEDEIDQVAKENAKVAPLAPPLPTPGNAPGKLAPTAQLKQPVPPGNQPIPPTNKPIPPTNKPIPPGNQPIQPIKQPLPPGNQPIPQANKPVPPGNQPIQPGKQPLPPGNQPIPQANKPVPPGNQPIQPGKQPLPPGNQPIPQANKPAPPGNQPIQPGKQPVPQGNQRFQPVPPSTPPPTVEERMAKASEQERIARQKVWATETDKWAKSIDPKKYSKKKEIKRGGMGAVHLIESADGKGPGLVMKTATTPEGIDDMQDEEAAYKKIGPHPNILRCLGVRKINGDEGLVMEKIEGGDFSESFAQMNELVKQGKLSQEKYWGMVQFSMARTLEALAYMEEKGVFHNDIKSPNIMLDAATGEPKIIDMGLTTGKGKGHGGTPGYLPPEKPASGKSDVFSVGATTWEVAQGNTGQSTDLHHRFKYNLPNFNLAADKGPDEYGKKTKDGKAQTALQVTDDSKELYYTKADLEKERREIEKMPVVGKSKERRAARLAEIADKEKKFAQGIKVKKEGKYGADTEYTEFVNWLMNPDPSKRPSAKEALNHPFLRDRMLDDDSARESIKSLISERKKDPNAPAPKSGPTDAEIRANVKAVLLKEKEWKKVLSDGQTLIQIITKVILDTEKLLAKAKPGQEVLRPKHVAALQDDSEKLKAFEKQFGAQKEELANVTREFGTLVPPDPKKVKDKNARKIAEADTKTLQVLAKWSRDLVTSYATAVTTNESLKALLQKLTPPPS
jgi:serine/threonine protein kinase